MPGQIDDIKSRLNIVELVQSYIRLQKAGANYKALCPFHGEKTPSFNVSPARQIWHCFGCGLGGDHFKFVMQMEGIDFSEALELLAKRAGIQLRREDPRIRSERSRLLALVENAAKIFESVLHSSKTPERVTAPFAYLKKRGLSDETVKAWRIGYAPDSWDYLAKALAAKGYRPEEIEKAGLAIKSEQGSGHYDRFRNRIMFPIADASGRVVGFSGRIFDQAVQSDKVVRTISSPLSPSSSIPAKYINTPQTAIYDKSRALYGFDKAKESIRKENAVVLVEGQMDVVLSHQAGAKNAVAVSGTALTAEQLKILKRLAGIIISSFDRDAAGEAATKRSLNLAASLEFERKVAILPPGLKDPADAVLKDPEIWHTAVRGAKPIVQFFLETALSQNDRKDPAGKRAIAHSVLPEIKILSSEVEKSHWIQALSREIGVSEEALWREMKKTKTASVEAALPETREKTRGKDRRMQLESLLLGAMILYPEEGRTHLASIPREAITDSGHRDILAAVETLLARNISEHKELIAAMAEDLRDPSKYLAFQAEILLERIENIKERTKEILVCMKELEREWARDRLRDLSEGISKAEQAGDHAQMEALLKEFKNITERVR